MGHLHREDGPAIIHANGTEEWWYMGLLHRTDTLQSSDMTKLMNSGGS
jgi:hypothetical protein